MLPQLKLKRLFGPWSLIILITIALMATLIRVC